mgnify:CR=1 FL=1
MKLEMEKLKYQLDEKEIEQIKEIENITDVDYEIEGNYIPLDSFVCMAKDMLYEYHKIQEQKEDLEQDMEDNYEPKKIDYYDYYGVSRSDFH